jgi:hypothetical protein
MGTRFGRIAACAVLASLALGPSACVTRSGPVETSYPPSVARNPVHSANGKWWVAQPASEKTAIVTGMVSAFVQGANDGRDRAQAYISTNAGPEGGRLGLGILNLYQEPWFSKPVTLYVQSISDFYKQYPDVADRATVGEVLSCLSDKPVQDCAALVDWYRHGGYITHGGLPPH